MEFLFGKEEEQFREEIREFVRQELPADWALGMFDEADSEESWAFVMSISRKLAQRGWLTMTWPKEYGGQGASFWRAVVYAEEGGYWGIPGMGMGVSGVSWVGPSLILFGTEEQRKKYMPLIAAGDPDGIWCTGYSEPNAGSDFANLRTLARRDGDAYVINGQKIWTSEAHRARWCWLAVRTDPEAPSKHKGISIIIVDMKSPGVTVRPILNYIGNHHFNEVFFDDVRVPVENLVGEENRGWYQLMRSLGYERGGVAARSYGRNKRVLEELVRYAREKDLMNKAEFRQGLGDVAIDIETQRLLAYETIWKMSQGKAPTFEPSRDKVLNDQILEKLSVLGMDILGPFSQLDPSAAKSKWFQDLGGVRSIYYNLIGMSSAAGTEFTQKNIIGQFALGLPRSY
ncbi:MAG TPA: acyl-CoA dehydrogenase family protein [Thermodesulfobacteriota bacterium]|nr:acyl-CoA dehydrogenase family protein [Thermodesulfobacteriota bacterium]